MDTTASKPAKRSPFSFLTWWKVSDEELVRQTSQYRALKITQSARGQSLLLCLLSVAITVLLGRFIGVSPENMIAEAALWSFMGLMMYRGYRWAFIVAMVLWTLEKGAMIVGSAAASRVPFTQVIWWAIYMNVFYLGFKVESRRLETPAARA